MSVGVFWCAVGVVLCFTGSVGLFAWLCIFVSKGSKCVARYKRSMSGVLLVRIENTASGRHCGFYGGLVVSSAVGLWCLCRSAVVLWWCLVVFGGF